MKRQWIIGKAVSEEAEDQETAEEAVSEEAEDQGTVKEAVSEEVTAQEKCTRQFVLIAEMNVKFHLSHQKTDLFIAKTVIESTRSSKFIVLETF